MRIMKLIRMDSKMLIKALRFVKRWGVVRRPSQTLLPHLALLLGVIGVVVLL